MGSSLNLVTNSNSIPSSPRIKNGDAGGLPCLTPVLTYIGVEWNISFEERACKASKNGMNRCAPNLIRDFLIAAGSIELKAFLMSIVSTTRSWVKGLVRGLSEIKAFNAVIIMSVPDLSNPH